MYFYPFNSALLLMYYFNVPLRYYISYSLVIIFFFCASYNIIYVLSEINELELYLTYVQTHIHVDPYHPFIFNEYENKTFPLNESRFLVRWLVHQVHVFFSSDNIWWKGRWQGINRCVWWHYWEFTKNSTTNRCVYSRMFLMWMLSKRFKATYVNIL